MATDRYRAAQLAYRYPMLQYFTDRSFGIEIEFFGLNYLIYPGDQSIIKPYNIRSRSAIDEPFRKLAERYQLRCGTESSEWHFETDTSLKGRGGAELISPVLEGLEGLVEAYRAFAMLQEIRGVAINETCGFHVHHGVDRELFGCRELQQLVKVIHPMEEYFYLLIPGERQHSETCRPMEIDVADFLKECPSCDPGECPIKTTWYSTQNRFDPKWADYPRYDKTRYHGLNLHSYWYRGTIEFRHHSAVLKDIDEAMQWIIFTQVLVEMAAGHAPIIYYLADANKWMKALVKIYLAFGLKGRIHWVDGSGPNGNNGKTFRTKGNV